MTEFGAVHGEERAGDSHIMSSAPRVCRKCGAEIFADAPEGLCTACLFETGLNLLAYESVAGVGDPGPADSPPTRLDPDLARKYAILKKLPMAFCLR